MQHAEYPYPLKGYHDTCVLNETSCQKASGYNKEPICPSDNCFYGQIETVVYGYDSVGAKRADC